MKTFCKHIVLNLFIAVVFLYSLTDLGVASETVKIEPPVPAPYMKSVQNQNPSQLYLLRSVKTIADQKSFYLGLSFVMEEGWHIYWRTPGDSGLPPELIWSETQNYASSEIIWPTPKRYFFDKYVNYGYAGLVTLPVKVNLHEEKKGFKANLKVDYLVCKDVCLPQEASFMIDIPAGFGIRSDEAVLIDGALKNIPTNDPVKAGMDVVSVSSTADKLTVNALSSTLFSKPEVFVESEDPLILFSTLPQKKVSGDEAVFVFDYVIPDGQTLLGKAITITLSDRDKAIEKKVEVIEQETSGQSSGQLSLYILLVAFLGGLVLNVMPCVLPVLSLKMLSLVKNSKMPARVIKLNFLGTVIGILTTFLLFGYIAVFLKSLGANVGWGMQFQSPIFVVFMMIVLVLFALNLWGVYQINLPLKLRDALTFLDQKISKGQSKIVESFFSGVFVTLLATPCTAPFLGTALGFSLSRSAYEIYSIFFMIGLGLSFPYILLSIFPSFVSLLPKPGRWMEYVKKILGGFLLLTALWLASVLGFDAVKASNQEVNWITFNEKQIDNFVEEGRVVFVDITASWCLTCQVNKHLVIETGDVEKAFSAQNVVLMRGDMTEKNADISAYLARNGKYGIPFNAVYGPNKRQGIILPVLLSKQAVFDALRAAKH